MRRVRVVRFERSTLESSTLTRSTLESRSSGGTLKSRSSGDSMCDSAGGGTTIGIGAAVVFIGAITRVAIDRCRFPARCRDPTRHTGAAR